MMLAGDFELGWSLAANPRVDYTDVGGRAMHGAIAEGTKNVITLRNFIAGLTFYSVSRGNDGIDTGGLYQLH